LRFAASLGSVTFNYNLDCAYGNEFHVAVVDHVEGKTRGEIWVFN
jgi:hypothetical protein